MKKMIYLFSFISILMFSCDQSANMFLGVGQALDSESPKISITSPENGIYVNKSDITITGMCSDNVGVTRIRGEAGINETASVVTEEIKFSSVRERSWSVTFDKNDLDRILNLWRSGLKVTFTFTCYDAAGNTTVEHLFLYVDVEQPTVIINRPEVRFTEAEKVKYENDVESFKKDYDINKFEKVNSFVNKEFILKGYVDDDYSVKSTYINIYNATKKKQVGVTPVIFKDGTFIAGGNGVHGGVTGNSQSWEFKLDSTLFCPTEGWHVLEVVTEDDAGNEKRQFVDKDWIYINQAADIPRNNFTSFSPGFKLNAGNIIAGNGFDDDGMKEVWIKIVPEKEADPDTPYTEWQECKDSSHVIKKCSDFTEGVQLGNWSLSIPGKAGKYIIYAIPVDINGVAPQTPYEGIYASHFSIASEEDPVVGIKAQFRGATVVEKTAIQGHFYDNNDVTKMSVTCRFDDKDATEQTIELYNIANSNHNVKIVQVTPEYQLSTGQMVTKYDFEWDFIPSDYTAYKTLSLTFRVDDEDKNYGEDAITVYGDSERPVFSEEILPANNSVITDVIEFSGAVSDNVDVVSVTIEAEGSAWTEGKMACILEEKKVLSSGKYERVFKSPEITPKMFGGYVDRDFIIRAKDAVGNEATQIVTLKGDKTKPQIKFYDENGEEKKSGNYENTSKTINAQIKPASFKDESYRKIKSASYTVNNGEKKDLLIGNYNGVYYPVEIAISDLGEISGDVTLQITATDEAGNDGEGTIYFIVDDEAPSNLAITSPLLKNKADVLALADTVDNINENDISFYQNGEILLKGTISDNYKIDKTVIDICDISGESVLEITLAMDKGKFSCASKSTALIEASGIPGNFTIKLDTTKLPNGNYVLKTTAYDAAGNCASWGKSDAEEMFFKVLQDADKPRITFNIEDGATIYPGTILKGLLIDDDALSTVKYILKKSPISSDESVVLQKFSNPNDSDVENLDGVKQYTRQDWTLNKINGIGTYYLCMLAEDIHGTKSKLYRMTITVTSADTAFIKSISASVGTGGSYENGYYKGNVKILVGAAAGGESTLKNIYYRIVSSTIKSSDEEIDYTSSPANDFFLTSASPKLSGWHKYQFADRVPERDGIAFEFDSSLFVSNGTETITIEIKCEDDKAISSSVKDKISIDNEMPSLKVTSPRENVSVNKNFEISGSSNDRGAGVKDIYISYMKSPSQSVTLAEITNNLADIPTLDKWYKIKYDGEISWSHEYQSVLINNSKVATNYTIQLVVTDVLGNYGIENHTLKIDQDGDRPVIRNQNLSLTPNAKGEIWCKIASIYGTISDDDDGTLEIYISEDGGQNWSPNCYGSGSWEYNFKTDGEKNIRFKVIDGKQATFISKQANILETPKIVDSTGLTFGATNPEETGFALKVDTSNPSLTNIYFNKKGQSDFNGTIDETNWDSSFVDKIFGGDEKTIYILFGATDTNGINIEKRKLECSTIDLTEKIKFLSHRNVNNYDYFVYSVDIADIKNSYLTFKASVTDNSGLLTTTTFQVNIDNDAPSISITSHSDGVKIYGSDQNTIKGSTGDAHKTKSVEYAFSITSTEPDSGEYKHLEDSEGNNFASWEILFNKDVLNNEVLRLYGIDKIENCEEESYFLYLWVKATDLFGNTCAPKFVCLDVLPNGDKPTVDFSYPTGGEILGGTIRITGTAQVLTNEIENVYIQIDPSYDGNAFSATWEQEIKDLGYTVKEGYGIEVDSTSKTAWSLTINRDKKLKGDIAIRAYAVSKSTKTTMSDIVIFNIDNDVPLFGESEKLTLVQYDSTGTELKRKLYEADTWISGEGWYLEGSVEDDSGISKIEKIVSSGKIGDIEKSTEQTFGTNNKGHIFKIPLETKKFGTIDFILKATDRSTENPSSNTASFAINYDNAPPTFAVEKLSSDNTKRIEIENVTGTYTINGTFEEIGSVGENQSGFERIAMYFTRTVDSTTDVIDPMLDKGADGKSNRYDVNKLNNAGEKELISSDEIYWREATVSTIKDDKITLTSGVPDNVRKGGLVKVGGIIYRINDICGKEIIVAGTPATGADKAYFSIAQVIDNLTIESGLTTYYGDSNNITFDDGDQMVEGVYRSGASYTWTVSINSENILDGDVDVHFVAFDKAGNIKSTVYYGSVSNNTPRIAGVTFAMDNNINGTIEENEKHTGFANIYNATATEGCVKDVKVNGKLPNGNKVTELTLPLEGSKPLMTIKGKTGITAKIVGGNSGLQWRWKIDGYGWSDLKNLSNVHSEGDVLRADLDMEISQLEFLAKEIKNEENKKLQIEIWDKTEGKTPGKDSKCATINILADTGLFDTTAPTVEIKPFYWNSESDNSLYQNSCANGHIELEGDLPTDTFKEKSTSDTSSSVYDRDPKVSGKITIEGTASDNVLVKALYMTIDGFKGDSEFKVAERNADGVWKSLGTMASDSWACEISSDEFTKDSNNINWKFHWDTSKVAGVAKEDVVVTARVEDKGEAGLSTNGNTVVYGTPNTSKTDTYQMDVVPYITGVQTNLSALNKRNPTAVTRSALGKYTVKDGEEVTLIGYNLTVTKIKVTSSGPINYSGTGTLLNNENFNDAKGSYTGTLSEDNYATYAYNRQPNNYNNNLLTDDIEFLVWQFDEDAVVPKSGKIEQPIMKINPKTGDVGFAFVNGPLYFSMGGSVSSTHYSYRYWMGSFDFFTSVGFTYDSLGYSYGVAAGGDINASEADKFQLMSSRWGLANLKQEGSYASTNSLRLESIGQKGDADGNNKGTNYYDKQRIKSPTLATTVNGQTTNLYLAYYDAMNDEIRFKAGSTNSTSKVNFGNFTDNDTTGSPYEYRNGTVSMIAGSKTGRNAGEYISIGAIKGVGIDGSDVVVIVWYGSDRKLWYSYTTSSPMNRQGQTDGRGWSTPTAVFSDDMENAGEYCKLVVDNEGGIHIAAYDPVNLDLCYAYMESYNGGGFETCVVDSNGVTGSNLTLDVAKVGDNWIPYIGYYATYCIKPKYAYKVDTSSMNPAGSVDDMFTGAWESMVVPTSSTIEMQSNQHNDINIAVWKDADGKLINNPKTGTNSHATNEDGYSKTAYGQVYGNGTSNPIFGYVIKSGASRNTIETAQMK